MEETILNIAYDPYNETLIKELYSYDIGSVHIDYDYVYFYFQESIDNNYAALIQNYGDMNISSFITSRSTSRYLFENGGVLYLLNVSVGGLNDEISTFNPNSLRSDYIILQHGHYSTLNVYNSYFQGSAIQIQINDGSVNVYDTIFEYATQAIFAEFLTSLKIIGCTFSKIGVFYGPFTQSASKAKLGIVNDSATILADYSVTIAIESSSSIKIGDNLFNTYDFNGFILAYSVSSLKLYGNTFIVNTDDVDLFYKLSDFYDDSVNDYMLDSLVTIQESANVAVFLNKFLQNDVDIDIPWINFMDNNQYYGYNTTYAVCLSANTFHNLAFVTHSTNITSCFRTSIINCFNKKKLCKNDESYGAMNAVDIDLYDDIGDFILDANVTFFVAIDSYVAMDNVNFTIIDDTSKEHYLGFNGTIFYGNIFLLDSYLSGNATDIWYPYPVCDLMYNQRLRTSINSIAKLMIICDSNPINYSFTVKPSLASNETKLVEHFSGIKIELSTNDGTYFPGQITYFEWAIMDKHDYIITDSQSYRYTNHTIDISISLSSSTGTFATDLYIYSDICYNCDNVFINDVSLKKDIDTDYLIDVFVATHNLVAVEANSSVSLRIIDCPSGYGQNRNGYACKICDTDKYNILANNSGPCKSCDPDKNPYIDCYNGGIYVSENYWMGFDGDTIVSANCPSGYCCTPTNNNTDQECNFIWEKDQLCALNRDYKSPLCGRCIDGYSESMNSTKCVKCDKIRWYYVFLPFGLSLIWTAYLILFNTKKVQQDGKESEDEVVQDTENGRCMAIRKLVKNRAFVLMMKTIFAVNIMYYEQAISQILVSGSFELVFAAFSSVFNMEIVTGNAKNEDKLWCFVDGLTAKGKILIDLIIPSLIITLMIIIYLVARFGCNGQLILFKKRQVKFFDAFIAMILLLIGKILEVLFRILNCQQIGHNYKRVHFYFGYEECYGFTYFISLFSLFIVFIVFGILFIISRKSKVFGEENRSSLFRILSYKYKQEYWYWEFIIFIRRIIIAMLSVSANNNTVRFVFIIIMLFFVFFQYECDPFMIKQANNTEFILLSSLIFVIITQLDLTVNETFVNVLVSFLVVFPVFIVTYHVWKFVDFKQFKPKESYVSYDVDSNSGFTQNLLTDTDYQLMNENDDDAL